MSLTGKRILVALLLGISSLTLTAVPARAAEPAAIVADVVLLRPLGVASAAIGTGVYIVTLPVTYFTGDSKAAAERLVARPLRYTFQRPLGQFESE